MGEMRVAIVEDHALTRQGIISFLKGQADIQVVGDVATANEGLKLLQENQPDVAIVDILLPDVNGIELVRRFRESISSDSSVQTRFMMLTGFVHEEMVLAAFAAGVDSYFVKTTKCELFLEALQTTHAGESWIDSAIARIVLKHAKQFEHAVIPIVNPLTERELEILGLIVQGYSNAEIAEKLFRSLGTIKTHVRNILNKLCASDRTEAAVLALRAKLIR